MQKLNNTTWKARAQFHYMYKINTAAAVAKDGKCSIKNKFHVRATKNIKCVYQIRSVAPEAGFKGMENKLRPQILSLALIPDSGIALHQYTQYTQNASVASRKCSSQGSRPGNCKETNGLPTPQSLANMACLLAVTRYELYMNCEIRFTL